MPSEANPAPGPGLAPATSLGPVRLNAGDADALATFYRQTVGLRELGTSNGVVALGAADEEPLVELVPSPGAPLRPPGTTGLFHLAILVPSRTELARALQRVSESGRHLTGASDHLVSEALYLRDPEGNGIEIYRDRDRDEWRRVGGEIEMDTLPLDLESVLSELGGGAPGGLPPRTRIGHVHLNVTDIPAAQAFYRDALGFDVTVRTYPGALFLSAGGYHHHVGLNTWIGEGARPPPRGARGLERFEIVLPSAADLEVTEQRLREHCVDTHATAEGISTADPSGNRILLSAPRTGPAVSATQAGP